MVMVSIVIPVYKTSESLELIAAQVAELEKQREEAFELILVNDSPGFKLTAESLSEIQKSYSNAKVVTLRKNQGQHMALLVGLSMAKGDYVITMDDDLQHPVSEIPKLIKAISENKDIDAVFAVPRYLKKKHGIIRNFGSFIINKLDTLFLKKPEGLVKSSFRIMTKSITAVVVNNFNAMPAVSSLLIKATNNITNIEVEHKTRSFGKSNYSSTKLISLTLNNILHYSALPLKIVGFLGILGFLFSLLFILLVLIRKIFWGMSFPGYASTVTLISFFGGLNLFAIGIVGEYLIRIIKEQQKPNLQDLIRE